MVKRRNKIGRNERCPCGSGKKYKHCHGGTNIDDSPLNDPAIWDVFDQKRREFEAREFQRCQQQGYGREIISWADGSFRFVAVGGTLLWSKQWLTFHDFLKAYPNHVFGQSWLQAECLKPEGQRHPLASTRMMAMDDAQRLAIKQGHIYSIPQTAAGNAFLRLSYNLYMTAHNAALHEWLVGRLKNSDQYWGALYETHVAALFVCAGFKIEFENEKDTRSSHCEFVAVSPVTGSRYSVEAKSRNRHSVQNKTRSSDSLRAHLSVGRQLKKALKKETQLPRVVFVEVAAPEMDSEVSAQEIADEAIADLNDREESLFIGGSPAPSAYVFITNYPYFQAHDHASASHMVLATGFKIPDFGPGKPFANAIEYVNAKEKHADMHALLDSIDSHSEIPSTFDGSNPLLEFTGARENVPLRIGQEYLVPSGDGSEVPAVLEEACVLETEQRAYCIYKTRAGKRLICTNDLSAEELAAYQLHPETFFGVRKRVGGNVNSITEAFEFHYEVYKGTAKEKLLEWMRDAPDIAQLKRLSHRDLAIVYCERLALSMFASAGKDSRDAA